MSIFKKILRIIFKAFLWLLGFFMLVFGMVWLVLKVPSVQNYLVSKATKFISDKTHTRVELERIDIGFPKSILLQGLYLDDLNKDTLLAVKQLEVDIDMLALINKKLDVNYIGLEGLNGNLKRSKRSGDFNFQFLADAFTKKEKEKVEIEDTTSSPWGISARKFELKDCRFSLQDSAGGIYLQTSVPGLVITIDRLDLKTKNIDVKDLLVRDVSVRFSKGVSVLPDTAPPGKTPWNNFSVENLEVNNTGLWYADDVNHSGISAKIDHLKLEMASLDMLNQLVKSENIELANSNGSFILDKDTSSSKAVSPQTANVNKKGWRVEVKKIKLDSNNFSLDYSNIKKTIKGIDFNHLALAGISAEINEVFYAGSTVRAQISKLEAQERSGFGIRSMKTKFDMDSIHASMDGFELLTNRSRIGNKVNVSFTSIDKVLENGNVKVSLVNNIISIEDVLVFAPQLIENKFISRNANKQVKLNLEAEGTLKQLLLKKLFVSTASATVIDVSGNLKNLRDPNSLFMDLKINRIQSSNADLKTLLPDSIIPSSITIPASFVVSGKHKGGIESFKSNIVFKSTFGNAVIDSDIKNIKGTSPGYDLKLKTQNLNVGKIIQQPAMGQLTGVFKVKGSGFDKNKAVASADMEIKSISLQNYDYKNINIKTTYNQGLADILADVNDTNLALTLSSKLNLIKGSESYKVDLKLKGIDLYGLNLTKEHIQLSAWIDADLQGNSSDNYKGNAAVRNIMVVKKNKEYKLDSLIVASVNQSSGSSMNMSSSLMSANFKGNVDIFSVATTIQAHINNYFDIGVKPVKAKAAKPQNFEFDIKINEDPFVREVLLPSLNDYRALTIKGGFDSEKDLLALNLNTQFVEYATYKIKDLNMVVNSDKQKIDYALSVSSFINGSMQLEPTVISGSVADNRALINLLVAGKTLGNKLSLKSQLAKTGSNYRYSLMPDGFNIMNQAWNVSPENYIEFGDKHLYIHDFALSNANQLISVGSTENSKHADLLVNIKDFKIRTISQIIEQQDSLFKGTVNGKITLKDYQDKMAFTSDIMLSDVHYKSSAIGDLHITAGNINSEKYNVTALLTGMGNNVNFSGYFNPKDTVKALDFKATIKALQLSSFESFTGGELRKSSGFITGDFTIEGSTANPSIKGDARFLEARTNVKFLNQTLYMQNESISLNEKGIHFNTFHIRDTLNNMATIDGDVLMHQFKDIHFDLQVNSDDFMVMNTTAVQNKLYYGKIILNSDIKIKGTPEFPKVIADIRISKGSHFTFALPESKLSVDRGEGVVVFLYDPEDLHPIMMRREKQVVKSQVIKGIDLSAHVKVRPSSTFKILVDPVSGDSLVVKGDADINFAIDPSGKMSLSGIYTISDGKYKAFIEGLATREFKLVKGSKIVWNGDPLDAIVDLKALYNVKTSSRELMSIGSAGLPLTGDSSVLVRPLNFEVYLIMEGELLKPSLSFNLDMADNQKNLADGAIYAKLNEINENEAERNKQVFSLLILNRFMSSNAPGGGTTASGFARSSVSRMMSDQLNQLSSQYLKGVEVNVDLQSYDYNSGGKTQSNTQANVSVKKSFDRLSVQVGSNVQLEGPAAQNSNAKNYTGDIEVGYKLTKDGRYQAKAFRQNEVDGIANGVITETGVGVMYTRNYNKAKELLKPPKKKGKRKKE